MNLELIQALELCKQQEYGTVRLSALERERLLMAVGSGVTGWAMANLMRRLIADGYVREDRKTELEERTKNMEAGRGFRTISQLEADEEPHPNPMKIELDFSEYSHQSTKVVAILDGISKMVRKDAKPEQIVAGIAKALGATKAAPPAEEEPDEEKKPTQRRARKKVAKKASTKKAPPKEEPEEDDDGDDLDDLLGMGGGDDDDDGEEVTLDDVQNAMQAFMEREADPDKCRAILKKFIPKGKSGKPQLVHVPESKWADLIEALSE